MKTKKILLTICIKVSFLFRYEFSDLLDIVLNTVFALIFFFICFVVVVAVVFAVVTAVFKASKFSFL